MPRRVGETFVVTTFLALCVPSLVGAQSAAVQSGNVLIHDSFSGSDELPLVDHPPDVNRVGSAWAVSGTPGVVLRGQRAATDVGVDALALINAGGADVTVKADWIPGGPYGAVVFRATDVNNYLMAFFANHSVYLYRMRAGVLSLLADAYLTVPGTTAHRFEVRLAGTAIEVWYDGVKVIESTQAFNVTATRHGLKWANQFTGGALSTFDNFEVTGELPPTVDHVVVTPQPATVLFGSSRTLSAVAYDAANMIIPNVGFSWTSATPAIASVTTTGVDTANVTGLATGASVITATPMQGAAGTTTITVNPGNVLVHDSFSGSDGSALVDHPPDVNQIGSAWAVSGTPGVVLRGQRAATDAGVDALVLINAGGADVTVKADWTPGGPYGAVVFRATDVNNYLMAFFANHSVYLYRMRAGVLSLLADAYLTVPGTTAHRFEVRLAGTAIEVWYDGVKVIESTQAFNVTATRHGLKWANQFTGGALSTFDNFEVTGTLPPVVDRVFITPGADQIPYRGSKTFRATAFNSSGEVIPNVSFAWSTGNESVISVEAVDRDRGKAEGWANGEVELTATPIRGASGVASATVDPGRFVISDTFISSDGTSLSSHIPEISKPAAAWRVSGTGSIQIQSQQAVSDAGADAMAVIDAGISNAVASVVWYPRAGNSGGLVFRASDANNYYVAEFANLTLYLLKIENGVTTLFTPSMGGPARGDKQRVEVRLNGPKIELWWDNNRMLETTQTFNQTATGYGIRFFNQNDSGTATFDSFQVLSPPDVVRVDVSPSSIAFPVYTPYDFSARAYDAVGEPLDDVSFTWRVADDELMSVVTVTPTSARVTANGRGQVSLTAGNFWNTVVGTSDMWATSLDPSCVTALPDPGFYWDGPGGNGQFSIIAEAKCEWTVTSSDPSWLVPITTKGRGSVGGYYFVKPNGSPWERSGYLSIRGHGNIGISQGPAVASPGCFNGFFPGSITVSAQGGRRGVDASAPPDCVWTSTSTASWLHAWTAAGMGSGELLYIVDPNEGPERSAAIIVNGETFVVSQEAGPSGVGGDPDGGNGAGEETPGGAAPTNSVQMIGSAFISATASSGDGSILTILVNGSNYPDDIPAWMRNGSPEFNAIAETYGVAPISFHWQRSSFPEVAPPFYVGIAAGAFDLANFIAALPPGEVNLVAHSHGGNVAIGALFWLNGSRPIKHLINLGTPVNFDFNRFPARGSVYSHCLVSSKDDLVQFFGASPGQINGFGAAGKLAGEYSYQAIQAALNGDWGLAAYLTQLSAEQTLLAQRYFMSTKIELTGLTILFEQGSHDSLHEPPVWNLVKTYCATN